MTKGMIIVVSIFLAFLTAFVINDRADDAVLNKGDSVLYGSILAQRIEAMDQLNYIATQYQKGILTKAQYDELSREPRNIILQTQSANRLADDFLGMSPHERAETYRKAFDWGLFPGEIPND